jgi:undecaprenyl-diphosphatase
VRDTWRHVRRAIHWLGGHELGMLLAIALAAAGIWTFIEVADAVLERDTHHIDRAILLAMRTPADPGDPVGPPWFEEMARDVTALGGTVVLGLGTLIVVGYLLLRRQGAAAALITVAVIGAQIMSALLKGAFDRPRPDLVPAFTYVYTASFPSGHAMLSAAVYLTFGTQLARIQPSTALRGYLIAVAVAVTVAVGASRVYLGVHWPSDVLAGWAAGAAWALLVWAGARVLARRRHARGEIDEGTDRSRPADATAA